METIKVNMNPNPLDVQTIHASQNDGEARQWEFELHNNGELIDTSEITEQLFFKAYKGGTEQLLPENTSTPTTSPFKGDIRYPQGLLTDQEFTYRQSPTESDGLAKITDIKGNTLVWNQLVPSLSAMQGQNGTLSVADNVATITSSSSVSYLGISTSGSSIVLPKGGHKYLLTVEVKSSKAVSNCNMAYGNNIGANKYNVSANTWTKVSTIASHGSPSGQYVQLRAYGSFEQSDTIQVRNWNYFDLTAMGLDSITTIEEFTSLFPLPFYDFNQGTLIPFSGNGIKTVGKNQLNLGDSKSATANGVTASYDASTQKVTLSGTNTKTDSAYILINFTPSAIPKFKIGETYVVSASSQIPTNTYFNLVYRDTNNALQGLSLTQIETRRAWWFTVPSNYSTFNSFQIGILKEARQLSGEFGVQLEFGSTATAYEPYTSSTLSLPISTYFPTGMKRAGNVYDELTESKAITRISRVDLGSLNWIYVSSGYFRTDKSAFGMKEVADAGIKTALYETVGSSGTHSTNMTIWNIDTQVRIINQGYTDANAFKTAMNGVMLYYELATPTETSFTTASLVTENAEIPLSNNDGTLIGKCTEQLSENPGFIDAKIKLSDSDGECYSNKIQLHVERSPQ